MSLFFTSRQDPSKNVLPRGAVLCSEPVVLKLWPLEHSISITQFRPPGSETQGMAPNNLCKEPSMGYDAHSNLRAAALR